MFLSLSVCLATRSTAYSLVSSSLSLTPNLDCVTQLPECRLRLDLLWRLLGVFIFINVRIFSLTRLVLVECFCSRHVLTVCIYRQSYILCSFALCNFTFVRFIFVINDCLRAYTKARLSSTLPMVLLEVARAAQLIDTLFSTAFSSLFQRMLLNANIPIYSICPWQQLDVCQFISRFRIISTHGERWAVDVYSLVCFEYHFCVRACRCRAFISFAGQSIVHRRFLL